MAVTYHKLQGHDGWIVTEIVADTPSEKQAAVAKFLADYRVYDAMVISHYETSLTSRVKRFYKM